MLNTYAGLTIPLIASATATLFRQFFLTVPDELVEAARIDGAGPMRFMTCCCRCRPPDRGAVRHPVHLRLEPVNFVAAAAGDDQRGYMYPVVMGIKRMIPAATRPTTEHHHGHRAVGQRFRRRWPSS